MTPLYEHRAFAEEDRRGTGPAAFLQPLRRTRASVALLSWLLIGAVTFLYIYGIQFSFLPTYTSRLVAVLSAVWLFAYLAQGGRVRIDRTAALAAAAFALYLLWVGILSVLYAAQDLSLFTNAVLTLGQVHLGALFIAWWIARLRPGTEGIALAIQIAAVAQALFVILYFASFEFREMTWAYVPQTSNIDYQVNLLRSRGLTNGGGATLAVVQSVGFFSSVFLLMRSRHRLFTLYLVFSLVLVFASIVLSGRTGLLILPIALAFALSYCASRSRVPYGWIGAAVLIPVVVLASWLLLSNLVFSSMDGPLSSENFGRLARWVSSAFLQDDGRFGSRTIDVLLAEHWHLPDTVRGLIFGDPRTWELHRIPSDIGLIRRIYGVGMLGMLLGYLSIAAMCEHARRKAANSTERMFLVFLFGWLALTELKEPFLLKFEVLSVITLLFWAAVWSRTAVVSIAVDRASSGGPDGRAVSPGMLSA